MIRYEAAYRNPENLSHSQGYDFQARPLLSQNENRNPETQIKENKISFPLKTSQGYDFRSALAIPTPQNRNPASRLRNLGLRFAFWWQNASGNHKLTWNWSGALKQAYTWHTPWSLSCGDAKSAGAVCR